MSSDEDGDAGGVEWASDSFFGRSRAKKGTSKEEAIYGVFLDSEGDDSGQKRRKGGKGRGGSLEQQKKKNSDASQASEEGRAQEAAAAARERTYMPGFERAPRAGLGAAPQGAAPPTGGGAATAPRFARASNSFAASGWSPAVGGVGSETPSHPGLGFSRASEEPEDGDWPTPVGGAPPPTTGPEPGQAMEEEEEEEEEEIDPQLAAARERIRRAAAAPVRVSRDFGRFEKSTKGVGLKILQKFGFAGRLGKHGQGIAEPIAAKVRPNRVGLGTVREATSLRQNREVERHLKGDLRDETAGGVAGGKTVPIEAALERRAAESGRGGQAEEEDGDSLVDRIARERAWARKQDSARVRPARSSQSVVEAAMGVDPAREGGISRVVDMRGPEVRVVGSVADLELGGGAGLGGDEEGDVVEIGKVVPGLGDRGERREGQGSPRQSPPSQRTRTVGQELLHNLRVLVDASEADLHAAARRLRDAEAAEQAAQEEAARRAQEEEGARRRARRQAEVRDMVRGCRDALDSLGKEPATPTRDGGGVPSADVGAAVRACRRVAETAGRILVAYPAELLRLRPPRLLVPMAREAMGAVSARWTLGAGPGPLEHAVLAWEQELGRGPEPTGAAVTVGPTTPGAPSPAASRVRAAAEEEVRAAARFAFEEALRAAILPALRRAASREWQVRDPAPLLALWRVLAPLLPEGDGELVLDECVLPRLRREAEGWNPRGDAAGAHTWVLPWRDVLGAKLRPVFAPLRQRLSAALANWRAEDSSALTVLAPWHRVWEEAAWNHIVLRRIAPRLAEGLRGMEINPRAQSLRTWKAVLAWAPYMPAQHMVALLCGEFFPRWLGVLHHWLGQGADLREAAQWYAGWRRSLPALLVAAPAVQAHLRHALDMLNAATAGTLDTAVPAPPDPAAASYFEEVGRVQKAEAAARARGQRESEARARSEAAEQAKRAATEKARRTAMQGTTLTFREMVQAEAEAHGLVFAPNPKRGRAPDGQQLFSFGTLTIYLHDHIIYVEEPGPRGQRVWKPTGLAQLVASASATPGKGR